MQRSDALLSFSAGVMLGAAFFHMLPEAAEGAGLSAIPFVLVGFLFLFLLERFVLIHVCAEPAAAAPVGLDPSTSALGALGASGPRGACEQGACGHVHGTGCDVH